MENGFIAPEDDAQPGKDIDTIILRPLPTWMHVALAGCILMLIIGIFYVVSSTFSSAAVKMVNPAEQVIHD